MRKTVLYRKKAIPKLSAKKFETNGINLKIKEFSLYCKLGKEMNIERIVLIRATNTKE
jgi:hypothetical protein